MTFGVEEREKETLRLSSKVSDLASLTREIVKDGGERNRSLGLEAGRRRYPGHRGCSVNWRWGNYKPFADDRFMRFTRDDAGLPALYMLEARGGPILNDKKCLTFNCSNETLKHPIVSD
jgi:hypothetical protein